MPDAPAPAAPADKKTELKARLDTLTRKRQEAERSAESAQNENQRLQAQIRALTEQVGLLARRPAGRDEDDLDALLKATDPKPSRKSDATLDAVADLVRREIAPIRELFEGSVRQQRLVSAQQQAYREAVQSFPELADNGSEAFRVFSELWDNRPDIQSIPDGPLLVAEATRGLLVQQRQTSKETEVRKEAASPVPVRTRPFGPEVTDAGKAKELLGRLADEGARRALSPDEMTDLLSLKLMSSERPAGPQPPQQ